jgi:glycosyltransferase involved in cell wall biosynthesis
VDKQPLTLSVVIISWNQLPPLKNLLEQLQQQDYDPELYEIIVVDDGSTDGTREWLSRHNSEHMPVILGERNRGRSAARNEGIKRSVNEIIIMIDGDHTIGRDFLKVHSDLHSQEHCFIVGKSAFAENSEFAALNSYFNGGGATKMHHRSRLPGRYFLTRNCSVRREDLVGCGMFDERFARWGGEDLELGVRLVAAGIPLYGDDRCLALHHHWRPVKAVLDTVYEYGQNCVPIIVATHPSMIRELKVQWIVKAEQRIWCRFILFILQNGLLYNFIRSIAQIFRKRRLPRIIFDYLHWRQYSLGLKYFMQSQRTEESDGGNY